MNPSSEIVSFINNFTLKKFGVLVLLLVVCAIGFVAFESYTSHFEFSKATKQAELLEKLVKIREENTLLVAEEEQRIALLEAMKSQRIRLKFSPGYKWPTPSLANFLYGAIPWFLMGVVFMFSSDSDKGNTLLGLIFVGSIFSMIASFIDLGGWLMDVIVVPLGLIVVFIVLIGMVGSIASMRINKQKKTANNGS